ENSVSETPFLTVKTTGETPVPQFCHGLLKHLTVGCTCGTAAKGGGFTGFGARAPVAGKRELL
ncbi:MAG: hypothetical protein JXQ75_18050, partial [Phycisphaerae bacterium]|nr:hypothetical protein [Phycisphaerae bacterium]